jgi:hypothetical protein
LYCNFFKHLTGQSKQGSFWLVSNRLPFHLSFCVSIAEAEYYRLRIAAQSQESLVSFWDSASHSTLFYNSTLTTMSTSPTFDLKSAVHDLLKPLHKRLPNGILSCILNGPIVIDFINNTHCS